VKWHAVHQNLAAGRIVEAREEIGERGLPRPGWADQGHHTAFGKRERYLVEHPIAVTVAKTHPVEDDVPGEPRFPLPGPLDVGRRLVQHLEDPSRACQRHGHQRGERGDLLEGRGQLEGRDEEADDRLRRERRAQAEQPRLGRRPNDGDHQEAGEHFGKRARDGGEPLRADDVLAIAVRLVRESRRLPVLFVRSPDQPDGTDALGDGRRDLAPLVGAGVCVPP